MTLKWEKFSLQGAISSEAFDPSLHEMVRYSNSNYSSLLLCHRKPSCTSLVKCMTRTQTSYFKLGMISFCESDPWGIVTVSWNDFQSGEQIAMSGSHEKIKRKETRFDLCCIHPLSMGNNWKLWIHCRSIRLIKFSVNRDRPQDRYHLCNLHLMLKHRW